MRITCPSCGTGYDVPEDAIPPQGRKVRCRTCGASWVEAAKAAPEPEPAIGPAALPPPAAVTAPVAPPPPPPPAPMGVEAPAGSPPAPQEAAPPRRLRAPLVALSLVVVALLLGIAVASAVMGPSRLAGELGLAGKRVPLDIAITRPPDWREIAGDNQLFAISGRISNPTATAQTVPDVRADIRNKAGKVIHHWIIARPARELPPGGHVDFDGAAIDVPRDSATVALSFVGEKR